MHETYRIGLDIGSTTLKTVALNCKGQIVYSCYRRHNAQIQECLTECLREAAEQIGDNAAVELCMTGSIGMGVAEKCEIPFIQEVVAATRYVKDTCPQISSMIDIGGEDAKVVIFKDGKPVELRMNGNCAGGTGAFIDQMAILMGAEVSELNELALNATHVYPIASRCGVFCKTDVQNLIAKNATREDIAKSIFHAVVVQTVTTLAHGQEIAAPLLFVGGPLTFIPALRNAFKEYLKFTDDDCIVPENSQLIPATGAALSALAGDREGTPLQRQTTGDHEGTPLQRQTAGDREGTPLQRPIAGDHEGRPYRDEECGVKSEESSCHAVLTIDEWISSINEKLSNRSGAIIDSLQSLFSSEDEYRVWQLGKDTYRMNVAQWKDDSVQDITLGIDSGSTTTKIVALDAKTGNLLYSWYASNAGNPINAVEKGLKGLMQESQKHNTIINVTGSQSTGYGEDLIRVAFGLDGGIVETMAHYMAARHICPDVSFILDIGGQDMKAIFVDGGVINRIEINEACSSGCGSFIETFAKSLKYTLPDFVKAASCSSAPCDLGTRCTVFMNSKVKQVLREGASISDIAAGLSYSVIKNCLYKVLKMKDTSSLGDNIVVQGGTMRNDSVVRAFELLTGKTVFRSDRPELMGAYGCALYASERQGERVLLENMLQKAQYTASRLQCHGCENNCLVVRYTFGNGKKYYSGNRCERIFTNKGVNVKPGRNAYTDKIRLLFDRKTEVESPKINIGIPRVLNMFEEYPFWHTLFTRSGIAVTLSGASVFTKYEANVRYVMADNICFPAKLVHSHIQDLMDKHVDRIFMPFVVYETKDSGQNSFNCPIVSGYSQVVNSVQPLTVPLDSPVISFKDKNVLLKQCTLYLKSLGIDEKTIKNAFNAAVDEQRHFEQELVRVNREILSESISSNKMTLLIAGRPYHADPLIQHKLSDVTASMGVNVITDDITRGLEVDVDDTYLVSQWAYPNRILKAAKWVAMRGNDVQFMQLTSFGCGPDAFIIDEVRGVLQRQGKALTLLKVDDVTNVGSLKLRVRSVVESLKLNITPVKQHEVPPFITTPVFGKEERRRKILAPFFTPFISPLIPDIMKLAGYDVEILPISNATSCDLGLHYANNEVCYPATLIVGDIIRAFQEGKYKPEETAVAITQTGGQCRATNYISLIKRALVDAGFADVPVVSLSFGGDLGNEQPGFKVPWLKIIPIALRALLFSDCIAKFYYASVVREKTPGKAKELMDKYLDIARHAIRRKRSSDLLSYITAAAREFNSICVDKKCARVGVVGEIFLKFHPFAQKDLTNWLISQNIEVVPPLLTNFFLQTFVNNKADQDNNLESPSQFSKMLWQLFYGIICKRIKEVNKAAKEFRYFSPFEEIFSEAKKAEQVVTLQAQFGEGWLLPAEIISLYESGATHVVSLQPFGCIANQIVSKGIEHKVKKLCPGLSLLSLDFDSGVSAVNITNRLLLFTNDL